MLRDPNKDEHLAARAIVRTLDACGDNVEKKERFVAMTLRDLALALEDQQATIRDLSKLSRAKRWR